MDFQIPYASYVEKYSTKTLALYHALRDSIVAGLWPHETRLPSTRRMADQCSLSRGTVNQVYETLASEGYLNSETGRGTYIAYRVPDSELSATESPISSLESYPLSSWASKLADVEPEIHFEGVDFHLFLPDLSLFPQEEWNRCFYTQVREMGREAANKRTAGALGDPQLRESIARYLTRARGLAVQAEHVAVVGGSMQAIALLMQLLVSPGEPVVAEMPGYAGIRRAIHAAGGRCIDAGVDLEGVVPQAWDARVLFVTPARQFPTGAVLSLERRQALLRWANERQAVIVEDDYDSEFRHRGQSLEPLKLLDRTGRVVYLGSFTKTLLPSLRIGFAVLPPALVGPFRRALALYEPQPVDLAEQRTLAAFIASGQYERHLRRMKRIYSRKFALLTQLVNRELSHLFQWTDSDAGLHLFGWWKGTGEGYRAYRKACLKLGVRWSEAVSASGTNSGAFFESTRFGIYLNFPHLSEEEMIQGIRLMKQAGEDSLHPC